MFFGSSVKGVTVNDHRALINITKYYKSFQDNEINDKNELLQL